MVGPRPQRPEAMLHPGTRIPNHALLSLSHAALPLTMLSHLSVLLWFSPMIMTVERPTHHWSRGSLSLDRSRIMGNLRVIDLSILPPLVDLISYHDPQTANVYFAFKQQIALISLHLFLDNMMMDIFLRQQSKILREESTIYNYIWYVYWCSLVLPQWQNISTLSPWVHKLSDYKFTASGNHSWLHFENPILAT